MLSKKIGHKQDLALVIMRMAAGVVFAAHGIQKLEGGVGNFASFLNQLAVPFPEFFAWVVALTETIGGILLIIGALSRVAAALLSVVMIVAIIKVKSYIGLIAPPGGGAGAELDLSLLAIVIAIVLLGPGSYSVEKGFFGRELS
ncbi:MAG: DoxX family protein [Anaplasmataceae bacterium]|nr:DoxX family protein [Anaplasmataceae bacterium]